MAPTTRSSSYAVDIANRMREVRAGLSFSEVARRTDVNRETARRYMTSGRPSAEFLARLSDEFGVSGTWLLTGRGAKFEPHAGPDGSPMRMVKGNGRSTRRRRRAPVG